MNFLERAWTKRALWLWLLWPVSLLFLLLANLRKRSRLAEQVPLPDLPVIVVGNISVGGTGKTPFLIALCKHLQKQGKKPGIISRGYGGNAQEYPLSVSADSVPAIAGDEPVLIAKRTGCPVIVDPDRVAALSYLLEQHDIDIVLSDDGLQHYALPRHIEICLIDGQRLLGNQLCLPAGFLREPANRLRSVDLIVVNGGDDNASQNLQSETGMEFPNIYSTNVEPGFLINLASGEKKPFAGAPFNMGTHIQSVTGIGNPQRFNSLLEELSYPITPHIFPDHHLFSEQDFESFSKESNQPIVMTEKDGIKCQNFAAANFWYLEIDMVLDPDLLAAFDARLQQAIGD